LSSKIDANMDEITAKDLKNEIAKVIYKF